MNLWAYRFDVYVVGVNLLLRLPGFASVARFSDTSRESSSAIAVRSNGGSVSWDAAVFAWEKTATSIAMSCSTVAAGS